MTESFESLVQRIQHADTISQHREQEERNFAAAQMRDYNYQVNQAEQLLWREGSIVASALRRRPDIPTLRTVHSEDMVRILDEIQGRPPMSGYYASPNWSARRYQRRREKSLGAVAWPAWDLQTVGAYVIGVNEDEYDMRENYVLSESGRIFGTYSHTPGGLSPHEFHSVRPINKEGRKSSYIERLYIARTGLARIVGRYHVNLRPGEI